MSIHKADNHLLTLRAAVVLLIAIIIGAAVGALTYLATKSVASAVLAGASSCGTAVLGLHKLIGP